MEYKFSYKFIHIAPRKLRLITNLIKDMNISDAMIQLKFISKDAAKPVYELLKSAISSCKEKNITLNDLKMKLLTCDGGPTLKHRHYKSRGRALMIKKRTSHLNLILEKKDKITKIKK